MIARHRRRSVNTPMTSPDSEEATWLRCANTVTTAPLCVNYSVVCVGSGVWTVGWWLSLQQRGTPTSTTGESSSDTLSDIDAVFSPLQSRARGSASECAQRARCGGRQERQPRGQEKQPGRGRGPVQVRPCTSDKSGLRQSDNIRVSSAHSEQRYWVDTDTEYFESW